MSDGKCRQVEVIRQEDQRLARLRDGITDPAEAVGVNQPYTTEYFAALRFFSAAEWSDKPAFIAGFGGSPGQFS